MYTRKTFYSVLIITFVLAIQKSMAQCAMCKAVVQGGAKNIAEGVNNGITYLMIFPYILVGVLVYFLYKKRKN